jgi:hypothetical protein
MWCRLACVVIVAAVSVDGAPAQESVAQFYRAKQITVIVGSSAGGGYDIYARLLARHMPRHIPGNPAMVVSNMTGAGSNAAAAHVYNVAPKDGTVIGALQNSAVLESLLDALLGAAGLEASGLRPVEPRWAAPVDSDRKAAWEGAYPGEPRVEVRIEAASYHGRPVWFEVLPPWAGPGRMRDLGERTSRTPIAGAGVAILALAMPLGGILLARHNLRLGRGDQKGAFRIALFVFVTYSLARLVRADHVAALGEELWILIKVLAYPCFWAIQVWLLYMALEPYARRRWPQMLISWKRLLAGRPRDPLVGRDILIGCLVGTAIRATFALTVIAPEWLGKAPLTPDSDYLSFGLASLRDVGFRLFVNEYSAVLFALAFLFLLVLLRSLLRIQWLAVTLWCVVLASPLKGEDTALEWALGVLRAVLFGLALVGGGLLSMVVALFVSFVLLEAPLTLELSAWYASRGLPTLLVLAGLAIYGFHTSLAGKSLLGQSFLED